MKLLVAEKKLETKNNSSLISFEGWGNHSAEQEINLKMRLLFK